MLHELNYSYEYNLMSNSHTAAHVRYGKILLKID